MNESREAFNQGDRTFKKERLKSLELAMKADVEQRSPSIPESKRKVKTLLNDKGNQLGLIEQLRERELNSEGTQDLWFVVDFDDVINQTTRFQTAYFEKLHAVTGLPAETIEKMYRESKVTEGGNEKFRHEIFLRKVEEQAGSPGESIDAVVQALDYQQYVDPAVERSLLAIKALPQTAVRVSVLSFGDTEYQRKRIFSTTIPELVDEVIITEGSKREVIEELLHQDYQVSIPKFNEVVDSGEIAAIDDSEAIPEKMPMVVFVDDSPEQGRDYDRLLLDKGLVNVRFRKSQAKRSSKPHGLMPRIVVEDTPSHDAAVELFRIAELAARDRAHLTQSTNSTYDELKSKVDRENALIEIGLEVSNDTEAYIQGEQ